MAETKDQKISESNISSMISLLKMMSAENKGDQYKTYLTAAKELMLQYEAYKEACFSDEQAFRLVQTVIDAAIRKG